MEKLRIPTIEETVHANAYEARMHFLYPDGSPFGGYNTWPGQVSEPTAEAAQVELGYENHPGLLMWVDFAKPEVIGTFQSGRGERFATVRHKVGEIAIAADPGKLRAYSEVLEDESEPNPFIKMWLGRYAMDRTNDSTGHERHPLTAIGDLYMQAQIEEGLAAVTLRAQRKNWDPRINTRAWYAASLARAARKDYPELFTGGKASWHRRMGIALKHASLSRR